jgi:UDP-glucose 4-epimerase
MDVLVTGGSGFLGSHVVDILLDRGYAVKIVDRKQPLQSKVDFLNIDVTDYESITKAVRDVDYVYHLAAVADIEEAQQRPLNTVKVNILGTANVLEASRVNKVKRVVLASSIYVYSKYGSFYRVSKQTCESLCETYYEVYNLPYTIIRYGSLYGPRAGKDNRMFTIINEALTKGRITYTDIAESREFIHVYDAARYSVEILDEKYENSCVLLTGEQRIRINELVEMINEIFGNRLKIVRSNEVNESHYRITPYFLKETHAKRIALDHYVDLGEGILNYINELKKEKEYQS